MDGYADLLIRVGFKDGRSYTVEPRFSRPGANADVEPDSGQATFDLARLQAEQYDPVAYGTLLTQGLFGDERARAAFREACAFVEASGGDPLGAPRRLRLRLLIDADTPELHALRWETLSDPRETSRYAPLATDQRILFSRYLRSGDWREVRPPPRGTLRALTLIANPRDITRYQAEGQPL